MLVTAVGVPELAPLPSRSPLFATNFDSTACTACCEEYSHAAFASRIARAADARLTKDRRVPTLSRENRWGGNSKYFIKFIRGQMMTVCDLRKLFFVHVYISSFIRMETLLIFPYIYIYFELHTLFHQNPHWMALHKYLVLNFIYFIRSKEPLLAEQSLWGVKRLAFAVFNVLQSYRLPSFTCATVRNMFYSGDLLSPKGALGQIWVRVFYI